MKGIIISVIYIILYFQVVAQPLPSPPYMLVKGDTVYIDTVNHVFTGRIDYEYWTPRKLLPLTPIENSTTQEDRWSTENLTYKNGLLDGYYVFYWENGNPQFELTLNEGLAQGIARQYYSTGILFIEAYLNDSSLSIPSLQKEAGKCQIYISESGGIIYGYSYEDSDPLLPGIRMGVYEEVIYSPTYDGPYKCYWPNGTLMQKSFYLDGKQIGYAYYYDETGALTAFEYYDTEGYPLSWGIKQPDGSIKGYTKDNTN